MENPIITRTLKSGKALAISVETETRYPKAIVVIGDTEIGRNTPFGTPGNYRIICDGNAVLPITDAEYTTLKAAIKGNAAAPTLEEQRRKLVNAVENALDAQEEAFERGHNSDGSSAYNAKARLQPKVDAARSALAEFDASHPEIAKSARTKAADEKAQKNADIASGLVARGLD